jgi:hypothetical protein
VRLQENLTDDERDRHDALHAVGRIGEPERVSLSTAVDSIRR